MHVETVCFKNIYGNHDCMIWMLIGSVSCLLQYSFNEAVSIIIYDLEIILYIV